MKLNDFNQPPKKSRKVIREMHEDQPCGQAHEPDHEVNMARSDLYSLVKNASKIHDILTHVTEHEGLRGWQQSYITLAADYINSVYDSLNYDEKFSESKEMVSESNYERATWTGPDVPAKIKQTFDDAEEAQAVYDKMSSDSQYSNVKIREFTHYPYGPGIKYDPENPVTATAYEITADTNIQAGDKIVTNIRHSLEYTISGKSYKNTQGYMHRESDRAYADMPMFKDEDGIRVVNYKFYTNRFQEEAGDLKDACWKGYKAVGLKDKGGRKVPNCVPESEQIDELRLGSVAKTVKRTFTGHDLDSRIEHELKLADEAFRYGDVATGKHHFGRYMRLIKLSQSKERPAPATVPKAEPVEERNVLKNIKRVATGRDITSRVRDELEQAGDAAERGDTEETEKHNRRYDRLQRVGQKPQKVDELFGFGKKKPEPKPQPRREVKPLRVIDKAPTPKFAATTAAIPRRAGGDIGKRPAAAVPDLSNVTTAEELLYRWRELNKFSKDHPTASTTMARTAIVDKAHELKLSIPGITESKNRKTPGV